MPLAAAQHRFENRCYPVRPPLRLFLKGLLLAGPFLTARLAWEPSSKKLPGTRSHAIKFLDQQDLTIRISEATLHLTNYNTTYLETNYTYEKQLAKKPIS